MVGGILGGKLNQTNFQNHEQFHFDIQLHTFEKIIDKFILDGCFVKTIKLPGAFFLCAFRKQFLLCMLLFIDQTSIEFGQEENVPIK